MDHIKSAAGIRRKNSENCEAIEYEFDGEKGINSAVIELTGRYPENGFAVNAICKEMVYVIEGTGIIATTDKEKSLGTGDMIRIEPQEKYYFEGDLKLLISSSPAWYPEQYQTTLS